MSLRKAGYALSLRVKRKGEDTLTARKTVTRQGDGGSDYLFPDLEKG